MNRPANPTYAFLTIPSNFLASTNSIQPPPIPPITSHLLNPPTKITHLHLHPRWNISLSKRESPLCPFPFSDPRLDNLRFSSSFVLLFPLPSASYPTMASPRAPALVRNVSLPVLHNNIPTSHPRPVTRVSSFSTLVKPSLPSRRELTDSDDDDGMVPELPYRSCQDLHLLSEPYPHHSLPAPPPPQAQQSSLPTPLRAARFLVRSSLSSLSVFLPSASSAPHTQLKFMFISAVCLLLLVPTTTLCYLLPSANNLHILTLLIAAVPLIARATASVFLSTILLVAIVMTFTFTASALFSPVLIVWSSVVPVITFATLGNRLGLASSALTAASVAAVDFSAQEHVGNSRLIIASWLLFLGVLGVVQKQIHAVVKYHTCILPPDSSTVRRKAWYIDHNDDHHEDDDDQVVDDSDAEVPDSVLLRGRAF